MEYYNTIEWKEYEGMTQYPNYATDESLYLKINELRSKGYDFDTILRHAPCSVIAKNVKEWIDNTYHDFYQKVFNSGNIDAIQYIFDYKQIKCNIKKDIDNMDYYKYKLINNEFDKLKIFIKNAAHEVGFKNDLDAAKLIVKFVPPEDREFIMTEIIKFSAYFGDIDILKYFITELINSENIEEIKRSAIRAIISELEITTSNTFKIDAIKFIMSFGEINDNSGQQTCFTSTGLELAALSNNLEVMKFLLEFLNYNMITVSEALSSACLHSHREIIEYLLNRFNKLNIDEAIVSACRNNYLEVLVLLFKYKTLRPYEREQQLKIACEEKAYESIDFLLKNSYNIQFLTRNKTGLFKKYNYIGYAHKKGYNSLGKYCYDLMEEVKTMKSENKIKKTKDIINEIGMFPDLKEYLNKAPVIEEKKENTINRKKVCKTKAHILMIAKQYKYASFLDPKHDYSLEGDISVIDLQLLILHNNGILEPEQLKELEIRMTKSLVVKLIKTYDKNSKVIFGHYNIPKMVLKDRNILIELAKRGMLNIDYFYNLEAEDFELFKIFLWNMTVVTFNYINYEFSYQIFLSFCDQINLYERIKEDIDFVKHIAKCNITFLNKFKNKEYKELAKELVTNITLSCLPESITTDKELVLKAIEYDIDNVYRMSSKLKNDESFQDLLMDKYPDKIYLNDF